MTFVWNTVSWLHFSRSLIVKTVILAPLFNGTVVSEGNSETHSHMDEK